MDIQKYSADRTIEIADLFHQSVHAVDPSVYSSEQKEAWAPTPVDYELWSERLHVKQPFLAVIDNRVAGFMELDADGYIDCAYTHPDFQGKGVASTLYESLLKKAMVENISRLYVDASIIAKPFFEHRGFSVINKKEVKRNGELLVNFSMEKCLGYEGFR